MNTRSLLVLALVFFATLARAQVITFVTPNSGIPGKTIDVVIRGINTHFQNGVSVADFGSAVKVQKFHVSNTLTATATIHIESAASVGFRRVAVTTGSEVAELENGFEVFSDGGSQVKANLDILPIESISLNDVDLSVPQNTPILLFINIYNDKTPKNVSLVLHLSSTTKGYIGNMTKGIFALQAGEYKRFSNRDFTRVNLNGQAGNNFLREVKVLGTFPPDDYFYKLEIVDEHNTIIATADAGTVVTNPKYNPELITPGATFDRPVEEVYTPLPLFQWFGQMDKYQLSLYEVMPNQTPEEVVRNIYVFRKDDISASNLLYPAYAEKLVPGKVYAWQVLGKINTAKGVQALPSEVYRFRYMEGGPAVDNKQVSRIEISPQEITVGAGEQFQFSAVLYGQDSSIIQSVKPIWQLSSDKATIDQNGLFRAGKTPGTVAVIVKSGAVSEYAVVTIAGKAGDDEAWLIDGFIRQLFGLPKP